MSKEVSRKTLTQENAEDIATEISKSYMHRGLHINVTNKGIESVDPYNIPMWKLEYGDECIYIEDRYVGSIPKEPK